MIQNQNKWEELLKQKQAIQKLEEDIKTAQKLERKYADQVRSWSQLKGELIRKLLNNIQ